MPINAAGPLTVFVLTSISSYTLFLLLSQTVCRAKITDAEAKENNKSCSIVLRYFENPLHNNEII